MNLIFFYFCTLKMQTERICLEFSKYGCEYERFYDYIGL